MSTAWLAHERYCAALGTETDALRAAVRGADLGRQVPTCPDWTLYDLAVHVGQAHRWAETIVRTRATEDVPEDAEHIPGYQPAPGPDALDAWLAEGAALLAATLREAGADLPVWTWAAQQRAGFWARRMTIETLVHRADAALAAGREFTAAPDLAADGIDEWLEIVTDPAAVAEDPDLAQLRGTGQTLHLHATDSPLLPGPAAEWVIVRDPEGPHWRREHTKGDVALRAPLTDLLLAFQRRLPLDSERLELLGDRALFEHWLAHTAF